MPCDLLNIKLNHHSLTERRIRLLAAAFRKGGSRTTEDFDW